MVAQDRALEIFDCFEPSLFFKIELCGGKKEPKMTDLSGHSSGTSVPGCVFLCHFFKKWRNGAKKNTFFSKFNLLSKNCSFKPLRAFLTEIERIYWTLSKCLNNFSKLRLIMKELFKQLKRIILFEITNNGKKKLVKN